MGGEAVMLRDLDEECGEAGNREKDGWNQIGEEMVIEGEGAGDEFEKNERCDDEGDSFHVAGVIGTKVFGRNF